MNARTVVGLGILALAFAGCEAALGLGNVHFVEPGGDGTDAVPSDAMDGTDTLDESSVDGQNVVDATDACTLVCAGSCVDTLTDPQNCGACGLRCAGPHVTTASCADGACNLSCDSGFGDCDGLVSNGCEIDLTMASNHCGTCGNSCAGPHAFGSCMGGTCSLMCNTGFADCNRDTTDGCEADLTLAGSCGSCGSVCPGTDPTCVEPGSVASASVCCRLVGGVAGCIGVGCNAGEHCFSGASGVYCCL